MVKKPTNCAIDIGYGHLKVLPVGSQQCRVIPSVVAKSSNIAHAPELEARDAFKVDGAYYTVGEEAVPLLSGSHVTSIRHDKYTTTPEYRALFYAGLSQAGVQDIDLLITGVPVKLFLSQREQLAELMTGSHGINDGYIVNVRKTIVIPQPLGGFFNCIRSHNLSAEIQSMTVLVVDPGSHFFDWLLVENMRIIPDRSGASHHGFSKVIDFAELAIEKGYGARPARTKLDAAARNQDPTIYAGGNLVEVGPYFKSAAKMVATSAAQAMLNKLGHTDDIDMLVVVGGPRKYYMDVLSEAVGREAKTPSNALCANVFGYREYGEIIQRG